MPAPLFKKGNQLAKGKGRPKGSISRSTFLSEQIRQDIAQRAGITPLEFLVSVMRDPKAKLKDKFAAAHAAAPYMHRRMPIAIEGGDPGKPIITLEASQLRNLTTKELTLLRELFQKIGVATA